MRNGISDRLAICSSSGMQHDRHQGDSPTSLERGLSGLEPGLHRLHVCLVALSKARSFSRL